MNELERMYLEDTYAILLESFLENDCNEGCEDGLLDIIFRIGKLLKGDIEREDVGLYEKPDLKEMEDIFNR